jgi:hypothetical protein
MPGGDRTGPFGAGPRTGRAAGYCTGNRMPGFANFGGRGMGAGGGFGYGRGFGRGRGNRFYAGASRGWGRGGWFAPVYGNYPDFEAAAVQQDEREFLLAEARNLKSALDEINRRLDEMQKPKGD